MEEQPVFCDSSSSQSENSSEKEVDETSLDLNEPIQSFNEVKRISKSSEQPGTHYRL